jgi:hypothetical protein
MANPPHRPPNLAAIKRVKKYRSAKPPLSFRQIQALMEAQDGKPYHLTTIVRWAHYQGPTSRTR